MESNADLTLSFWKKFNDIAKNDSLTCQQKVEKLLQFQKELELLPNEELKLAFKFKSNVALSDCYIELYQKYKLTALVEDCKHILLCLEKLLFASQLKDTRANAGANLENFYQSLANVCQAKNHQRDVAYCYQNIARVWEYLGVEKGFAHAITMQNIALSKIPNMPHLTLEQLLEKFPHHVGVIKYLFKSNTRLKHDPVEQTEKYLAVYDQAEQIIQEIIQQEGRLARCPEQYWNVKRQVLEERFGIRWKSPRVMNPQVRF